MRPALPLSRLEIRRDRTVHGAAVRTGLDRVPRDDPVAILSAGRTRRRALDLYGAAGTLPGSAGIRIRAGAIGAAVCVQAPAGMQLAAGFGRWHRLESCFLAAPRCVAHRSADAWIARQPVQHR